MTGTPRPDVRVHEIGKIIAGRYEGMFVVVSPEAAVGGFRIRISVADEYPCDAWDAWAPDAEALERRFSDEIFVEWTGRQADVA
ncbi:MAG: hypothetical protein OJJ54_24160 [Pseudonocardia sp.]|nr:hypothetical protein [Pseudonocardia sp.]